MPILPAGLATSRLIKLDSYPQRLCALLCSPISAVKMGGPFSLRCLSPLGSPAGGAGQTQMAALGMLRVAGVVSQREETGLFFFCVCRYPCINNTAWDASMRLGYFCNAKGQRDFKSTLAFLASHEACRRMAVFSIQLAGSYTRPASREARCRAAVKPRPTCFPSSTPAPFGAVWGQGALPLVRAMRPVAEWRYQLANRQGDAPDRRAARPVAERR